MGQTVVMMHYGRKEYKAQLCPATASFPFCSNPILSGPGLLLKSHTYL